MSASAIVLCGGRSTPLAPRFAAERPEIVDRIGEVLTDHQPAVRLQAAQNPT